MKVQVLRNIPTANCVKICWTSQGGTKAESRIPVWMVPVLEAIDHKFYGIA